MQDWFNQKSAQNEGICRRTCAHLKAESGFAPSVILPILLQSCTAALQTLSCMRQASLKLARLMRKLAFKLAMVVHDM